MKRLKEADLGLPPGYTLKPTKRAGHIAIIRPDGTELRGTNGMPIRVAFSPSDWRSMKNAKSLIRKALP